MESTVGVEISHRTPFELRWGGWFVVGSHAAERHLGNAVATDTVDFVDMVTPETLHVSSLEGRIEPHGLLSLSSDIVAMMVLDHQASMSSLITRLSWEAKLGDAATTPIATLADMLV